nr:MAG TPA: hypothetical protein [Crassvirales sp.]
MTISLNDKVIQASGVSLGEVLFMIAVQNSIDLEEAKSDLLNKGFIGEAYNRETYLPEGYFITRTGGTILNNIILDSDKLTGSTDVVSRIDALVPQLQQIYPEGKNLNNQYWRGNKTDIKRKLQTFFKKYGNDYTDEQIISATQAYVSGFNGDYKFMRLLQYFIWKEEIKDGTKVPISELANYIENAGQTDDLTNDWTTTLV